MALLSTAVIPAATALAAGAVAVGVATRIGSAMSQRQQQDGDGADEPSSSGAASAAPGRDGRRQGGGGGGRAGKAEKAGAAPAAEEEEIDLALEELRAFDERLLGPDASEWRAPPHTPAPASSTHRSLLASASKSSRACCFLPELNLIPFLPVPSLFARSPGEVAVWLQKSGFGAYADAFRAQDVDGRVLLSLGARAAGSMWRGTFENRPGASAGAGLLRKSPRCELNTRSVCHVRWSTTANVTHRSRISPACLFSFPAAFDDLKEQALGISSLGDRKRLSLAVEELKKEQDRKRAGGRGGR